MNYELRNICRRCVGPLFFARTVFFYLRRILFSLQYRYIPSRRYYPKEVREAFSKLPPLPEGGRGGVGEYTKNPSSPPLQKGRKNSLKLATGFLEYDGEPDWHQEFDDPEQIMSLHRWGWLLYEDLEKEQGIALIRSWLAEMESVPKGIAGTPYTVSERMVNAALFLTRYAPSHQPSPPKGGEGELKTSPLPAGEGQGEGIPDDVGAALLSMANHVARNIEYHGIRATGNHLVNNARALFFAGQMLGVQALSTLALTVLKDALPWLITKDGFLREESSHYHLLFTRWIIEMYKLAKDTHHQEMENYLEPWVQKIAERCWFFLVRSEQAGEWQMPLIGDVSPDCTPEWLVEYLVPHLVNFPPLPEGRTKEGWENRMHAFPESGWFRLDWRPVTIFWHVPQSNMIHRAAHGHGDMCSFTLFRDGKPIIIDPGRPTYQGDEGCLAKDHNSLTIDELDPVLYDRAQKFPAFYQKRYAQVDWKEEEEEFMFSISHSGFHRIKGDKIDHVRRFRIREGSLTVEDELRGGRAHAVEAFFHFASSVDQINVQNSTGGRKVIAGFTSYAYGVKINSPVTVVSHKDKFPLTLRYKITL